MQKNTKLGLLVFAVAFLVALGVLAIKIYQPEPSYLGKPVNYWLTDGFAFSWKVQDRPRAESAFRCMGSNAVPFLTTILRKTDGPFEKIYLRCYPKLAAKLKTRLPRPYSADELRGRAILALTIIGSAAEVAIPSLLNVLTNDPGGMRRANAIVCLDAIDNGNLREEVVDALKKARSDPDPMVARRATDTLKRRFPLGFLWIDHENNLQREEVELK